MSEIHRQVLPIPGGTRNGTVLHRPNRIRAAGENRGRSTHLADVAPTVLEAAGIPEPTMVNGVQQSPVEGISTLYGFDDADAPERHDQQYFDDDVWELYDSTDPTQAHDLAAEMPDKLPELQRPWLVEAARHNVLFSAGETADVGVDTGTPVAPDHESADGAFTGDIHWVQVDTGPNDADHRIRPEDRIRIAMGRQ